MFKPWLVHNFGCPWLQQGGVCTCPDIEAFGFEIKDLKFDMNKTQCNHSPSSFGPLGRGDMNNEAWTFCKFCGDWLEKQ